MKICRSECHVVEATSVPLYPCKIDFESSFKKFCVCRCCIMKTRKLSPVKFICGLWCKRHGDLF